MENHHVHRENPLYMTIFNSFVSHYQKVNHPLNPIKPPFSYGCPMVFSPYAAFAGFPLTHWPSLVARWAIALQLTCACSGVYIPLARAALTHLAKGLDSGAPQGGSRRVGSGTWLTHGVDMSRSSYTYNVYCGGQSGGHTPRTYFKIFKKHH